MWLSIYGPVCTLVRVTLSVKMSDVMRAAIATVQNVRSRRPVSMMGGYHPLIPPARRIGLCHSVSRVWPKLCSVP